MGPGGVASLFPRRLLGPRAGPLPWRRWQGQGVRVQPEVTPFSSPACLYFICKALEKDCRYSKGLVLKEKIFQEQPCLRQDSLRMFLQWWVPYGLSCPRLCLRLSGLPLSALLPAFPSPRLGFPHCPARL